jgi:hypothetical protein
MTRVEIDALAGAVSFDDKDKPAKLVVEDCAMIGPSFNVRVTIDGKVFYVNAIELLRAGLAMASKHLHRLAPF